MNETRVNLSCQDFRTVIISLGVFSGTISRTDVHFRPSQGSKDDGKIEKLVSRLRQKIEEHSDRKHIKTHRGVGYRYKKEGFSLASD